MEIQIVDKNDVGISNKERDEIDYSTDIYRVSALWLTNNKEDETYEVNTSKEAEEEIGLSAVHFDEAKKGCCRGREGAPPLSANGIKQWWTCQLWRSQGR
jgi:hypothetical protein